MPRSGVKTHLCGSISIRISVGRCLVCAHRPCSCPNACRAFPDVNRCRSSDRSRPKAGEPPQPTDPVVISATTPRYCGTRLPAFSSSSAVTFGRMRAPAPHINMGLRALRSAQRLPEESRLSSGACSTSDAAPVRELPETPWCPSTFQL